MLTTTKQSDDLLSGYLDGYSDDRDEYPDTLSNRSDLYKHGWLNGRDDRLGRPRLPASTIRQALQDLADADRDML